MPKLQILPSLLAGDFGALAESCRIAEAAGADGLHLDVMDGHFVPNLTMGPDIVRAARRATRLPLSVHLMCTHPGTLLEAFLDAGSDLILVHVEARESPGPLLKRIREANRRAGVVLNPETPAAAAEPWLGASDEILVMTVHPGFGGQPFLEHVTPKITELRRLAPNIDISVDGGIHAETAERCARAGANVMIAGTSLYRSADMKAEIARMRDRCLRCLA
ncbi:MAG: ribulose-phosphate 3-epimerase [Kiritimatiellae bacterium]|nr:ribulose-phosphate 3-epimerase [Kiritimatiellia bacterium]MDW8458980.1 ribulose-phosphate 3-epimerase [Verrucomicrobiota bacterium]